MNRGMNKGGTDALRRTILIEKVPFRAFMYDDIEILVQFSDIRTCYFVIDAPPGYKLYVGRYIYKKEVKRIR